MEKCRDSSRKFSIRTEKVIKYDATGKRLNFYRYTFPLVELLFFSSNIFLYWKFYFDLRRGSKGERLKNLSSLCNDFIIIIQVYNPGILRDCKFKIINKYLIAGRLAFQGKSDLFSTWQTVHLLGSWSSFARRKISSLFPFAAMCAEREYIFAHVRKLQRCRERE